LEDEIKKGMDRRTFLRRAAITGAAAAWATPIVQTVTARPAFASGTPAECGHSFGQAVGTCADRADEGCMGACQQACHPENCETLTASEGECNEVCGQLCPNRHSDDPVRNQTCCDAEVCNASKWTCVEGQACYIGALGGVTGVPCPTSTGPVCSS
jgi:hypothetical protein